MTPQDKTRTEGLLEQILKRVQSIDHNVEDIRDQLSDHFDSDWDFRGHDEYTNGNGYNHDKNGNGYDL